VSVGSVIGEVQPGPQARVVSQVVPQSADWKNAFAQCASRKIGEYLNRRLCIIKLELEVVIIAKTMKAA
jgi:hypothetical protein